MLGGDRYNGTERERSLDSNSVRRRESIMSNNLDNEGESLFSNCRNDEPRTSADLGQNSAEANSLAEINRLSSELNSRISREMDEMMNNVGTQIQRAINEAINSQVLPQIQNVMMAGSGRETRRGWEVPVERSEANAEEQRIQNTKADCRNEQHDGYRSGGPSTRHVHDTYGCSFSSINRLVIPNYVISSNYSNVDKLKGKKRLWAGIECLWLKSLFSRDSVV